MANKIYIDTVTGFEIQDGSGEQDIEQLKSKFNCPNLVDVTAEREAQEKADNLLAKERREKEAEKEALIQAKIREQAVNALKIEGKLDAEGNIKKEA